MNGERAVDAAEAARIMEADGQRRVQAVAERIQAALTEYNCLLSAVPQITEDGRVVAAVVGGEGRLDRGRGGLQSPAFPVRVLNIIIA